MASPLALGMVDLVIVGLEMTMVLMLLETMIVREENFCKIRYSVVGERFHL